MSPGPLEEPRTALPEREPGTFLEVCVCSNCHRMIQRQRFIGPGDRLDPEPISGWEHVRTWSAECGEEE